MPRPSKRAKLDTGREPSVTDPAITDRLHSRPEHNKQQPQNARDESNESSSESEDEDDEGELVTATLDSEWAATLKALRSKDPSIYDSTKQFYRPIEADNDNDDNDDAATNGVAKTEKPMYLQDYHRQNLLAGGAEDEEIDEPVQTYDQEQETLRKSVVKAMHDAADDDHEQSHESDADNDGLLVKKSKPAASSKTERAAKARKSIVDVENADRDPETFLSNFMTSRAWVPEEGSRFAHLESDDSEEERLADTFEDAYNLRFEDPATANAKMMSYARDAGKLSARRDQATGRKSRREKEQEIKAVARQEREKAKARLRNLKIDDVEYKIKQIREAAGIPATQTIDLDEWKTVLDGDFDDAEWAEIMAQKFGDNYYADQGDDKMASDASDDDQVAKRSKKEKKPTWTDDIDVADIAPELNDDKEDDSEAHDGSDAKEADAVRAPAAAQKEEPRDKKRAARQQRLAVEALVDNQLLDDGHDATSSTAKSTGFRYRESSPTSFGLTARDILFADDKQLNEFAGIKKHHSFRDEEKKRKDKKNLSKKARLRQWRKDTFGNEEGYQGKLADFVREQQAGVEAKAISEARKHKSSEQKTNKKRRADDEAPSAAEGDKKKRRRKKTVKSE